MKPVAFINGSTRMAMSCPVLPAGPRFGMWALLRSPKAFYGKLRRRYGDLATVRTPSAPLVIALSADGARDILTRDPSEFEAFHKEAFTGLAGAGSLWVLDGARHRRERQLLAPQFTAQRMRICGPMIKEVARRHLHAWRVGQRMRAYDAMLGISLDVILRVMFGTEQCASLGEGRRAVTMLLRSAHPMASFHPGFQSWWFLPWRRYCRAKRAFSMFVRRCVRNRRASTYGSDDVLGALLSAGSRHSDEEIRDQLLTIVLAGHETVAVALSWALYELSRHPRVLARLREELDALGPDPSADLIAEQSYLGAVCDETLRLHTILTEIGRITRQSCQVSRHQIPPGTAVGVAIGAIHQDPRLYPDPDAFSPERFLQRNYSAFEFLPFGGGHRRCLGAHFSEYEMRIVLALLVTRWDFEVEEDQDVRHNIGMGPKHGIRLRIIGGRDVFAPQCELPFSSHLGAGAR